MYGTSVSTTSYINIVTVHVTNYAANIANNKFFCLSIASRSNNFFYKIIIKPCTSSHNIAAIIYTISNSIIRRILSIITIAKIPCHATYIMCTTHFIFTVCCVSNIGIKSTTNNTAYIARIVIIIIFLLATAYITGISYILNFTNIIDSIICFTCNTAYISYIYINSFTYTIAISICSIVSVKRIFTRCIPRCRYSAAVFGILHSTTFHIANDTTYIVSAGNVHAVVNKVSPIADSRV